MSMRTIVFAALVALPLAAAAEDKPESPDSPDSLEKLIEKMPIYRVPTSSVARQQQREAGQRVVLIEARPGYIYRDLLHATMPITGVGLSSNRPVLHQPQENPDVHGCVTVSFQILPDGKTDAFEVIKSDPQGMFDKQALRVVYSTEYETAADAGLTGEAAAAAAAKRHERSIWFLVARPQRSEFSKVNDVVEKSRNRKREERRVACEGKTS